MSHTFKSIQKMEELTSNERMKDVARMQSKYGYLLAEEQLSDPILE